MTQSTGGASAAAGAGAASMAQGPGSTTPKGDAGNPATTPPDPPTKAVLYWLDIVGGTVNRANADGSEAKVIVSGNGISAPDGVNVDVDDGHLYWTNMGNALGGGNLGTVQRAKLDGTSVETIVPAGVGNTYKQMTIDHQHKKLYWSDREGAKVWRANFDGSQHEVLVSGHGIMQCVGIALDVAGGKFYFTDRNARKILRAGMEMPSGKTDATRDDLEELISFPSGAMPIDLDLDLDKRQIYWTDRMLGTINRVSMDMPQGATASSRKDAEVVLSGLGEPIGISLDLKANSIYFGALSGDVSRADLDGKNKKSLAKSGSVTGVTLVHVPM